ncbi:MAG TPA: tetratricopeptide repeat protein [Thermoanaerobaculia bacterium]|nr:tetratricopeptide repeat protein [Thermoanaerobaculia bacterium]
MLGLCVAPAILPAQETRIASDFEMQQMERQAAKAKDFESHLSAHLNLGDLHLARNENAAARDEYRKALAAAETERTATRKSGNIAKYATATMYAGFLHAKLDDEQQAFELLDEAGRYAGDDAKTWSLYADAMGDLSFPDKAAAAAHNAVTIAQRGGDAPLDVAICRFTLAAYVPREEAVALLEQVIATLQSKPFDSVRKEIARRESFEIYSTVRGDATAYISLLNRSQLRLAKLYEDRGEPARARKVYQDVLAARSDDPTALAAIARLSRSNEESARYFIDAFDANPFSLDTIDAYETWLRSGGSIHDDSRSPGAQVRHAVEQIVRGERPSLDALMKQFPNNDTLRELEGAGWKARPTPGFLTGNATNVTPSPEELRALMQLDLTPEQRVALDRLTFTSSATFHSGPPAPAGQTIFESGTIGEVPFKFSEPIAFSGTFPTTARLTYRILGVSGSSLLLEPVKLEGQ